MNVEGTEEGPMRCATRGCRPRKGAVAAEAAILLPFIALMFVVAVDFCRVFYATQTVQSCADVAALYASGTAMSDPSVSPTAAAQQAVVAEGASLSPPLTRDAVTISVQNGLVTATVTYQFQTLTGYPGLPGNVTITRTVQMRLAPTGPGG
jgi:Flp pilus assembly protein TadG